jgi:hypothetical protein
MSLATEIVSLSLLSFLFQSIRQWIDRVVKFPSVQSVLTIFRPAFNNVTSVAHQFVFIREVFARFLENTLFLQCLLENLSWSVPCWLEMIHISRFEGLLLNWMVYRPSVIFKAVLWACWSQRIGFIADNFSVLFLDYLLGPPFNVMPPTLLEKFTPEQSNLAFLFLVTIEARAVFDRIKALIDPTRLDSENCLPSLIFACFVDHPFVFELFEIVFAMDTPGVRSIAEACLRTDSRRLIRAALPRVKDVVLTIETVIRGLLPAATLATCQRSGIPELDFWISAAIGEEPEDRPTQEAVQLAVQFGDGELMKIVKEAIPKSIDPKIAFPFVFRNIHYAHILLERMTEDRVPHAEELVQGLGLSSDEFIQLLMRIVK